ncbi:MAG: hypothetical protein KGI59_00920, partial [Patescibacteria group bacterium]|nr:hypothetical protein [Patescibacteria group bacterium]
MKNSLTNWKTIAAAAIVIVVTVIAWLAPQPKSADVLSTTPVDLTSQPPATATPAHLAPPSSSIRPTPIVRSVTPAAPAKISPAVPQRPAYVKITASSATDYQSYITQLTNAQNWCKTISENAFNQLYAGSLESASFQYYYNQNS